MSYTQQNIRNLGQSVSPSESLNTKIDWRIDKILQWAYEHFGEKEFASAAQEFHSLGGKIFYDDPIYYSRTNYFLDFFIFERPICLDRVTKTPFLHFIATESFIKNTAKEEKEKFLALRFFTHSIFKIIKLKPREMVLQNLFDRDKHTISSQAHFDWTQGFEKKGVIQGFIYPSQRGNQLSSGMIIHPFETSSLLTKYLKSQNISQNNEEHKCLMLLAKVQLESFRHKHRPAKIVYHSRLLNSAG